MKSSSAGSRVSRMLLPRLWLLLFLTALAMLAGFLGSLHWFAELFAHFQVQYLGLLLVLGVAFVFLRQRAGWIACLVLALFPIARLGPLFFPVHHTEGDRGLRLISYNVLFKNENKQEVIEWLADSGADVIYLTECDRTWANALKILHSYYPYHSSDHTLGSLSYRVLSRHPIHDVTVHQVEDQPLVQAAVDTPAGRVVVFGAHPLPPMNGDFAGRNRSYLKMLNDRAQNVSTPAVILGDLNATRWASGVRGILDSGYKDTSQGFGYQPTWLKKSLIFAIPIDHVLTRDMPPVMDRWIGPAMGSDHSPVVVDFLQTQPSLPAD